MVDYINTKNFLIIQGNIVCTYVLILHVSYFVLQFFSLYFSKNVNVQKEKSVELTN